MGVGGSGQCTIVLGGKLFISTQFPVAESVFCLSFKFWLNFRFFKIRGFDLINFFSKWMIQILKLLHKLAWTVSCQNPKFHNFAQSISAPKTQSPRTLPKSRKSEVKPLSPYCTKVRTAQAPASLALGLSFFGDKLTNEFISMLTITVQKYSKCQNKSCFLSQFTPFKLGHWYI